MNSNDGENYPDETPMRMAEDVTDYGYTFPYLFDFTQSVAKAYKAACSPDFFLYDSNFKLVYRGQMDDSRPGNSKVTDVKDLRNALDAVLDGKPVSDVQKPSMGCSIKWKFGSEPEYYARSGDQVGFQFSSKYRQCGTFFPEKPGFEYYTFLKVPTRRVPETAWQKVHCENT